MSHDTVGLTGTSWVEVVAALTWENGRYSARCLGVPRVASSGESMAGAVLALADELSRRFSSGERPVGVPDRSGLWQPLPVEMLTALDVPVEPAPVPSS